MEAQYYYETSVVYETVRYCNENTSIWIAYTDGLVHVRYSVKPTAFIMGRLLTLMMHFILIRLFVINVLA